MQTHLAAWLDSVLVPTPLDQLPSEEDLVTLWTSLNVDPLYIDLLAREWHLVWDVSASALRVASACLKKPDFFEQLTNTIMACWSFKVFTNSRWVTFGESCRTFIATQLLGLSSLVSFCFTHGTQAEIYHLQGFKKLDQHDDALSFCVIACLASFVCDGALLMLTEDNGLLKTAHDVKECIAEDVIWLSLLPDFVWNTSFKVAFLLSS